MPSFDNMKNTIYDMVKAQTGIECSWDWQDAPKRAKPFFGLRLTTFRKVGRDVFIGPDNAGKFQMEGNRDFTLMVQGFGPGIIEKTYLLQTALERLDVHETFRAGGIFPYDLDQPIQDISGLDQFEPEERSAWDVLMRTDSIITNVPAGLIQIVNIESTYEQPGKPDIESTINIDSTTI